MLTPLSEDTKVASGMRMVMLSNNQHFTVLCNCSASRPRHFTQRFVSQNRQLFALPSTVAPSPEPTPEQPTA